MYRILKLLATAAVLATIAINLLANIIPYNGLTTGEVSDQFQVFFVPAGYVFSIWGLIYLGLFAQVIGLWKAPVKLRPVLHQFMIWLIINLIANSSWLFLWHYGHFGWSVLVMLVILISLIMMSELLWKHRSDLTRQQYRLLYYPTSIYLGWICAATVANITDYLSLLGWHGYPFDGITWACTMLLIVGAIAWLELRYREDWIIPLVVAWTSVGIAIKFQSYSSLPLIALIVAGLMLVSVFLHHLPKPKRQSPE